MCLCLQWFGWIIIAAILVNTVVLSLDQHPMSQSLSDLVTVTNTAFAVLFMVELILKVLGMGWVDYLSDRFNVFDAIIVAASITEMSMTQGDSAALSVFRMARVFRVLRLFRHLESMQMIVEVVSSAMVSIGYIFTLLAMFAFVYALLGMQLMGRIYDHLPAPDVPRNNFEDLTNALVTVFQVLAGEAWNVVMDEVVGASSSLATVYFISWVVLGQFILLNLFLAVLLDGFGGAALVHDLDASKSDEVDRERARQIREAVGDTNASPPNSDDDSVDDGKVFFAVDDNGTPLPLSPSRAVARPTATRPAPHGNGTDGRKGEGEGEGVGASAGGGDDGAGVGGTVAEATTAQTDGPSNGTGGGDGDDGDDALPGDGTRTDNPLDHSHEVKADASEHDSHGSAAQEGKRRGEDEHEGLDAIATAVVVSDDGNDSSSHNSDNGHGSDQPRNRDKPTDAAAARPTTRSVDFAVPVSCTCARACACACAWCALGRASCPSVSWCCGCVPGYSCPSSVHQTSYH